MKLWTRIWLTCVVWAPLFAIYEWCDPVAMYMVSGLLAGYVSADVYYRVREMRR